MSQAKELSIIVKAIDQATGPLRKVSEEINKLTAPVHRSLEILSQTGRAAGVDQMANAITNVGAKLREVGQEASALAIKLGLAGAGFWYLFKTNFLDSAANFERFETILEVVERSKEKAKQSMQWVSDFAAQTPYEISGVTDAFVKLKAYGLEPTNGLLTTLGDASAGMGKPLMQSIEAIADAVTGENERLKEFGIKARKAGSYFVYEYTNNKGNTAYKYVKDDDRKGIEKALRMIFDERFSGSMEKLSKTWGGMVSNMMDAWTRFTQMVMASGPFDWLKSKLKNWLMLIDIYNTTGVLKDEAEKWGKIITDFFEIAESKAKETWAKIEKAWDWFGKIKDMAGGWSNVFLGLKLIVAAPLINAVINLGIAFAMLGKAMLTTPIGWLILGLVGLAAAGYLIQKNWDSLSRYFQEFGQRLDAMVRGWEQGIKDWANDLVTRTKAKLAEWDKQIWDYLRSLREKWVELRAAGKAWVLNLWEGIKTTWSEFWADWGRKWDELVQAVKNLGRELFQAGEKLMNDLWEGMKSAWVEIRKWLAAQIEEAFNLRPEVNIPEGGEKKQTSPNSGESIWDKLPPFNPFKGWGSEAGPAPMFEPAGAAQGFQRQAVRTELYIKADNLPPGMEISTGKSNADFKDINLGYAMRGC